VVGCERERGKAVDGVRAANGNDTWQKEECGRQSLEGRPAREESYISVPTPLAYRERLNEHDVCF